MIPEGNPNLWWHDMMSTPMHGTLKDANCWEDSCYGLSRTDAWSLTIIAWVMLPDCPPLQAILPEGCFKDLKYSFWLSIQGKAEAVLRAGKTGERLQWIDAGCHIFTSSKSFHSPNIIPIWYVLRCIRDHGGALTKTFVCFETRQPSDARKKSINHNLRWSTCEI